MEDERGQMAGDSGMEKGWARWQGMLGFQSDKKLK